MSQQQQFQRMQYANQSAQVQPRMQLTNQAQVQALPTAQVQSLQPTQIQPIQAAQLPAQQRSQQQSLMFRQMQMRGYIFIC